MAFEQGHKKMGGVKKSGKMRKTHEWEMLGKELLSRGISRAVQIMNDADDRDFMFYYMNFIKYFKPQLGSMAIEKADGFAIQLKLDLPEATESMQKLLYASE